MVGESGSEQAQAIPTTPIRPEGHVDVVQDGELFDVEEAECEVGGEATAKPACRRTHSLPSVAEQRLHRLTHVPYRPWCAECVAGRKANWPHLSGSSEEERDAQSLPEVHMDYCFLRDEPKSESVPVIVLKDRDSRALSAHVVPYKGGDLEWAVLQAVRDMLKWGIRGDAIVRSDQEAALKDFASAISKLRADKRMGRTFPEHASPPQNKNLDTTICFYLLRCDPRSRISVSPH